MRVLIIGPFPPPIHGMSLANMNLYSELKKNHEVIILDTTTNRNFSDLSQQGNFKGIKIFTSLKQVLSGTMRILFSKRFDIIYITPAQSAVGYIKYVPFMWAAHVRRIPYLIHIHGGYFRTMYDQTDGWKKKIINRSLKNLSAAIVLGDSLKYMFEGLIPDEKIFVCENGVEEEIFATKEEIEEKIKRFKKDDTLRVLYLSNLMRAKGILDLLEAIKIIKDNGKKVHLDVAGAIEPSIKNEAESYFKELGDTVTYHGVVSGKKKKDLLLGNYIFCLPTYYPNEGQPISILEAMANGCAIVTTDHGGIKDIVNKEYGIFVEKNSPNSVAEAIEKVMKNYPERAEFAWKTASSKYKMFDFVKRVKSVLKNVERKEW
jgi:glycosyltransferase involved in cell wall biosynthesis